MVLHTSEIPALPSLQAAPGALLGEPSCTLCCVGVVLAEWTGKKMWDRFLACCRGQTIRVACAGVRTIIKVLAV